MIRYREDCCTKLPAYDADTDGLPLSVSGRLTQHLAEDSVSNNRLRFSAEVQRLPESRRQLIFRVRRQIAEGTYDTEEKLEIALARLFEAHVEDLNLEPQR